MLTNFRKMSSILTLRWKEELFSPKMFLIRLLFTTLNSGTLFVFWLIYMNQFKKLNGWTLAEVSVLYGLTNMVMGWILLLTPGCLDLPYLIGGKGSGEATQEFLDPFSPIIKLILNGASIHGLGSLALGLCYILYSNSIGLSTSIISFIFISFLGASIFTSFFCICNSLALRLKESSLLVDQIYEVLLLFMIYPRDLFSGYIKMICFSIVPVFWIIHIPAEILIHPNPQLIFKFIAAAFCFAITSILCLKSMKSYLIKAGRLT